MFDARSQEPFRSHARLVVVVLFLCIAIGIWLAVFRVDRGAKLTVTFLNVGQGDAIYIEAPNGNQVLVDGGATTEVLRALGNVMPFYDHSLDMVLVTHPDQDHVGGIPEVMKRMDVGLAVTTDNSADTGAYGAFEKILREKNTPRILAQSGEKFTLDEGVFLEVLFPRTRVSGWDTNTSSIVLRLSYGEDSFLLTGDSPQSIEDYLVDEYESYLKSDVLKLGHHGSRTSSSLKFLSAVDPEYAIISAGKDNKYGHPHQEVLGALEKLSIPYFHTGELGTLVFETEGAGLRLLK